MLIDLRICINPATETVTRIIKNFETYGCLLPRQHKIKARIENDERDTLICALVENLPTSCLADIARESNVSVTTVAKVLKTNKYHSYKIQKSNEIFPQDTVHRQEFCQQMMDRCNNDDNFLENILFTDETTFPLHGKHNPAVNRYWARENQHLTYDARTQYPRKLNV